MRKVAFRGLAFGLIGLTMWTASPARGQAKNPPKADLVATTEARSPDEEKAALHLPPGFEIQLVAAEPDVYKPMNLAFDDKGRLWVTSSLEYPWPAKEGEPHRDKVTILEDFGPDGRARKVSTFADGLNIPIGILPISQGTLVHSIPNIYLLRDTDGDGKADARDLYYGSIGFRDTHGMASAFTWGFDGWIYACHGFNNDSTVKGKDGRPIELHSGNTYRLRPDGSHIEQFTWGQVNPFGLSFDPLGNLYSCDCHTRPLYQLLRGARYDSFGKPHDGLGYGPPMLSHDHYSTGIAGVTYYAADHFPEPWRNTMFVGNVVTSRINHDRLEWRGSSPWATEQPDFVESDDPWFRPVDIELGPDGALYVADFYNRIIGHYEVSLTHPGRDRHRGRIWRIIYRGPDGKNPPPTMPRADWSKATIAELAEDLGHPNLAVRIRAANVLAERRGDEVRDAAQRVLDSSTNPFARTHGLWVLERIASLGSDALGKAAADPDRTVRTHAMRVLSERGDTFAESRPLVLAALNHADAHVRRAAADALGRHPSPDNLRPLLNARHAVPAEDTHLLHVVRMALRDQLIDPAAWPKLSEAEFQEADRRAIADVATGVPSAEAASYLLAYIDRYSEPTEPLLRYVHHVARFGGDGSIDPLLKFARERKPQELILQAAILKEMQKGIQERGAGIPEAVVKQAVGLARTLVESTKPEEVSAGIDLAESLKLNDLKDALRGIAARRQAPENQRTAALSALVAIDAKEALPSLEAVLADASEPIALREQAVNHLGRMNRDDARDLLLKSLPVVPSRLQTTIAVALAPNRAGAEALLGALGAGKASPRLLQERSVQVWLTQSGLPDLDARIAKLTEGLPPADQKVQELLDRRREGLAKASGDASLGAKVFEKNCAVCHQIGGQGAKVGPQLDGVGIRGVDRLLEDILDPNRNVDQAFRVTNLALENGQILSGLLLREEGEILVVADPQGKEQRVSKVDVAERSLASLSPMPANLAEQLPEQEFFNLLTFLLAQKQGKDEKAAPTSSGP